MNYLEEKRIVLMSLVDLEHCGFAHDEFAFELRCRGIESPDARWPVAIVVNVAGGHVVTDSTAVESIVAMRKAEKSFEKIINAISSFDDLLAASQSLVDKIDKLPPISAIEGVLEAEYIQVREAIASATAV